MIRGLFTAASGMLAGERRQDILSNNIANINTVGYKKDDSLMRSFPEMLLYAVNDHTGSGPQAINPGMPNVGAIGTGAFLEEVLPRFTQGILKPTDNKYGFAIVDPDRTNPKEKSFFVYNDQNGESMFSRDGDFHLTPKDQNNGSFLVNSAGVYVQAVGDDGKPVKNSRVRFNYNDNMYEVVTVDNTGTVANTIRTDKDIKNVLAVVDVTNTDRLSNVGNGMYKILPAGQGQAQQQDLVNPNRTAATGEIRAGFVEGSNVDLTESMTDMIAVMRSYEANQKVIRTLDSTLDKAVNSLGRI